jgi:hypothetical protein
VPIPVHKKFDCIFYAAFVRLSRVVDFFVCADTAKAAVFLNKRKLCVDFVSDNFFMSFFVQFCTALMKFITRLSASHNTQNRCHVELPHTQASGKRHLFLYSILVYQE